jgi:hypothetical protein
VFFERAAGNLRISLFFSLLAGNLVVGDRFGGAASTTRKSAQIDVISYATG